MLTQKNCTSVESRHLMHFCQNPRNWRIVSGNSETYSELIDVSVSTFIPGLFPIFLH